MDNQTKDVVILGAGPYGMAAAAHLCAVGFKTAAFGEAFEFWKTQMPQDMLLRSSWDASHISDPRKAWTLDAYQETKKVKVAKPIPINDFIKYGEWFQSLAVPALDCRRIKSVQKTSDGFDLTLEDHDEVRAKRVVVAAGISPFSYIPPQFANLPASLVSHTVNHQDLSIFANRQVIVVGSGQSAIESAAILKEHGAIVEVIARASKLRWLRRRARLHKWLPRFLLLALYPPTDVGPPVLNQIVARPNWFRRLPANIQAWVAYRSIRPAASRWLYTRVEGIRMTFGREIQTVIPRGAEVEVRLDNGEERKVDHILLATGYRVDIRKYPFLPKVLTDDIRLVNGYPVLSGGLESSMPGLHFLGAPAAISFGPLMRFVSGTDFAARQLAHCIVNAGQEKRIHPNKRMAQSSKRVQ